jgi:release factor glutamine methyltransferase
MESEDMQAGQWLAGAAGRLSAAGLPGDIEARHLLERVTGIGRVDLLTRPDTELSAEMVDQLDRLLDARIDGMPLQYLTRTVAFRHLDLEVGPGVFVPRPETEGLVDAVLVFLRNRPAPRVLELCLGSGAILAAVLSEHPGATGVGVELSGLALEYAGRNMISSGVAGRATLLEGDLYEPLAGRNLETSFPVVVANPPYIPDARWETLPRDVRDFEPRSALLGGPDGCDVIRRIVAGAERYLAPGGLLALEIDESHGVKVREIIEAAGGFRDIRVGKDLAGRPRYALAVSRAGGG